MLHISSALSIRLLTQLLFTPNTATIKNFLNTLLIFSVWFWERSNLWIYSLVVHVLNEINSATVQVHIKTVSPLLMAILRHHVSAQHLIRGGFLRWWVVLLVRLQPQRWFWERGGVHPHNNSQCEKWLPALFLTSCLLPALIIKTICRRNQPPSRNNRAQQLLFYLGLRTLRGGVFCTWLQLEWKPNGLRPSPLMPWQNAKCKTLAPLIDFYYYLWRKSRGLWWYQEK